MCGDQHHPLIRDSARCADVEALSGVMIPRGLKHAGAAWNCDFGEATGLAQVLFHSNQFDVAIPFRRVPIAREQHDVGSVLRGRA